MKNIVLIIVLLFSAIIQSNKAFASHAAGGEIIYEWLSDSTYRFYFIHYRDCSGIPEYDTTRLCFANPCNPSSNFTVLFNKTAGQTDTTIPGCAQFKNQCDSPFSTLRGFKKWVYSGVVTMPARCSSWKISGVIDTRNPSSNLVGTFPFYVETMMNNTGSYQGNSSPYFTERPVPNACVNQYTAFNNGAVDPDGDSLSTQLIMPRTVNTGGNCNSTPMNVTFQTGGPLYSIPSNPIGGGFSTNPVSGTMLFSASLLGGGSLTARIQEFRNGVLIGYVDRDIQVQVNQCNNATVPAMTVSVPTPIDVCVGQQLNFCWNVESPSASSKLVGSDDHIFTLPGSTVSYQLQGTDSVTGCLSWTPGMKDKGFHALNIVAKDTICDASGFRKTYAYYVFVYVSRPAYLGNDTAICPGGSIQLDVSGQGLPVWSVISGSANSLSCSTCQFPVLTPTVTTAYELELVSGTPCLNSKDTIIVHMLPYIRPYVSITAVDTNIATGAMATFTATPTNCNNPSYLWQRNGVDIPGSNSATLNNNSLSDLDVISVKMRCTDTCIVDTVSNKLTMHVGTGVKDPVSGSITIHPNPNTGEFAITAYTTAKEVNIEIVNTTGQVIYRQNNIRTAKGQVNAQVKANNISNGNYILRITAGNKVFAERLTIQR